jgi:EAL domain-containing protein (putative c-di-GMP-specific phosphodiesterase class I)
LSIAVNLTARQFFDEFLLQDLASILEATGMDPGLLELEVTESVLLHDVEKALRVLKKLKELGVRLAMDDFGTGYSSLHAFKQFPLDTIKINRSLIREGMRAGKDKDLTEAIIAMSKSLSLTVVAQGVETKEQADFLREHACDEFQGFYFNEPVQADQLGKLLRAEAEAQRPETEGAISV